jgi:hypothetical protein
VGIAADDVDAEMSRLGSSIRDGIGPRIPGIQQQPVRLENGEHALVLRVPRSFARPHVVTYKNHWKFYARTSNGKYQMDVGEVRRAFELSESVADRIRAFRAERLSRVVAGETPVPIEGTGRVVLHVVPISAFDSPASSVDLDIRRPPLGEKVLLPICIVKDVGLDESILLYPNVFEPHYNFDGVFCDSRLGTPGEEGPEGYAQLFRTGIIEAVDNDAFVDDHKGIKGYELDEVLVKAVDRYFRLLRELGVESPVFLLLSVVGVRDYRMLQQGGALHYYSKLRPIDRDDLLVPEVLVESLEQDLHALQQRMRPLLDAVWNAVGAPHSPHYDESGNWQSWR